jgi:hypothetical protein
MKVGKSEVKAATRHIVESSIDKENVVFTDQSTSYVDLKNLVDLHVTYKSTKESVHELKWVHIANAKRNLLGIYHVFKEKYLQHYLDVFCFKLNRRYNTNLFDNLIISLI